MALHGLAGLTISVALAVSGPTFAGEVRHGAQGHSQNPVFSPDGKMLAFEVNSYGSDGVDLYFSSVNGDIAEDGRAVRLPGTANPFGSSQVVVNPIWHPQGLAIFEGTNPGGQYRLYFIHPPAVAATELIPTTQAPGDLTFPTASSDAKMVAFSSDETGDGDLRVYNSSSGQVTQATTGRGPELFPSFNQDNTALLYARKIKMQLDLYKVDLATKTESLVKGGAGDQTRPIFAANGKIVFFTSERGDNQWDLAVVESSGQGKRVLARGIRLPHRARPAVSPDGRWVAFAYDDPVKGDSVFVAAIDGSKTVEVKSGKKACGEPAIGVQGSRTILAFTALPSDEADWRMLIVKDISGKL